MLKMSGLLACTIFVLSFHATIAEEPETHVYGAAGTAEAFYHGVEKSFGESHYDNPEFDANPDPRDQLTSYAKGKADTSGKDVIYPMSQAGQGLPADPEMQPEIQHPDGELNSLNPVSSEYVSQRRGSQLTSIGAGSGSADVVVKETRKGFYHKRRLLLLLEQSLTPMDMLNQRLDNITLMAQATLNHTKLTPAGQLDLHIENNQGGGNKNSVTRTFVNKDATKTSVSTLFHQHPPKIWRQVKHVEEEKNIVEKPKSLLQIQRNKQLWGFSGSTKTKSNRLRPTNVLVGKLDNIKLSNAIVTNGKKLLEQIETDATDATDATAATAATDATTATTATPYTPKGSEQPFVPPESEKGSMDFLRGEDLSTMEGGDVKQTIPLIVKPLKATAVTMSTSKKILLLELTKSKQTWHHNEGGPGDVGSGLAWGSSREVASSPFTTLNEQPVVPFLPSPTVGLDQVVPLGHLPTPEGGEIGSGLAVERPTIAPKGSAATSAIYPKWKSTVGSDAIASPKIMNYQQTMQGSNVPGKGWINDHLPMPITTVGRGVGEEVDKFGFPIPTDGK